VYGVGNQTHIRETLEWKVLDKQGDQVRLISATPTSFSLILKGTSGHSGGESRIDGLCAIYGGSKGTAQGLKIEDIQTCLINDYTSSNWVKTIVSSDWISSKYHELFINNGSNLPGYWLSSNCFSYGNASSSEREGAMRVINNGWLSCWSLFHWSSGMVREQYEEQARVRPVVTLNSNIELIGGNGTTGWTIE